MERKYILIHVYSGQIKQMKHQSINKQNNYQVPPDGNDVVINNERYSRYFKPLHNETQKPFTRLNKTDNDIQHKHLAYPAQL